MKYVLFLITLLGLASCSSSPSGTAESEAVVDSTQQNPRPTRDDIIARFAQMESDAIAEAFQGVRTDEGIRTGLYSIRSTGVSTKPILESAEAYLGVLTPQQRENTLFPVNDIEWRKWSNVDNGIYMRQGISLQNMNEEQKEAAFNLMQESLSAKGLQLSRDIMKTDHTLKEIHNDSPDFGEELYFFTIMGEPSETDPWGWQIDGHHLVINYFVMGDQIVMSPVFMGAEPVLTTTGKYAGNTLFQDEQNEGLALMQSLSPEEQEKATISREKTRNNIQAEANKDNLILNYEGIRLSELSQDKKAAVMKLAEQYISNIREGHQQVKMEEVLAHESETWFAWAGGTEEDAIFYYRIHSPVVLIEFDHQHAVGVPDDSDLPTRNHIHTIVRTPNGNDYGKDLLRQHLEEQHGG